MASFEYQLEIDVLGDEAIVQRLRDMGERAIFAEPALAAVVGILRKSERALWSAGRSWAPNALATIEKKGSSRPLVNTGALERSLTEEHDENQVVEIGNDSLRFGTKLWYAHFALGTEGAGASHSTSQPKRDVVRLRASDRAEITETLREYILHGEEALGVR